LLYEFRLFFKNSSLELLLEQSSEYPTKLTKCLKTAVQSHARQVKKLAVNLRNRLSLRDSSVIKGRFFVWNASTL
jgi:hypothetical protein